MAFASFRNPASLLALSAALVAGGVAAHADSAPTPLTVEVDRSRFIQMPEATRTIAVGNPAIADALVVGESVVLTGKAPGTTNLIAADEKGRLLINAEISVAPAASGVVRVFRGTRRATLHCAPLCEPAAVRSAAPDPSPRPNNPSQLIEETEP